MENEIEECQKVSGAMKTDLVRIKELVEIFTDTYDMPITVSSWFDGPKIKAGITIDL